MSSNLRKCFRLPLNWFLCRALMASVLETLPDYWHWLSMSQHERGCHSGLMGSARIQKISFIWHFFARNVSCTHGSHLLLNCQMTSNSSHLSSNVSPMCDHNNPQKNSNYVSYVTASLACLGDLGCNGWGGVKSCILHLQMCTVALTLAHLQENIGCWARNWNFHDY